MLKRVKVVVIVEIPDGVDLPKVGQHVTIGEFTTECVGSGVEKQRRRGDAIEMVHTAKLEGPEAAQVLKVEGPAAPLFEDDEG